MRVGRLRRVRLGGASGPSRLPLRLLRAPDVRQGLGALSLASMGSLVAGLVFGSMTHELDRLPGLIILVPAAIGMRGNIFGALGSRLATVMRTGQFRDPLGLSSRVGQSVAASAVLTVYMSVALAVMAWLVSHLLGVRVIGVADFMVISVLGGVLSSVVVLAAALGVALLASRRRWDLDNIAAPSVTAVGDLVTLPALWAVTFLLPVPVLPEALAIACVAGMIGVAVWQSRRRWADVLQQVVAQSLPVLILAGFADVLAGYVLDQRLARFLALPALLVLIPPFLEDAGALGGILSARLSSKLHLGVVAPTVLPGRRALGDIALTYLLALPVFTLLAVTTTLVSEATGLDHPGFAHMVGLSLLAGAMVITGGVFIAYYTAVASFRRGLDPDNYGIPIITSTNDLTGTLAVVASIIVLGMA